MSMIEVLIAFFVLSIGLMGLAALQVKSVQFNQSSYQRSQATIAAYDILDRMRLNRTVAMNVGNNYNIVYGDAVPANPITLVAQDLQDWLNFLANSLPEGDGEINCQTDTAAADAGVCQVRVRWANRFRVDAADGQYEELEIRSRI